MLDGVHPKHITVWDVGNSLLECVSSGELMGYFVLCHTCVNAARLKHKHTMCTKNFSMNYTSWACGGQLGLVVVTEIHARGVRGEGWMRL